jgi:hypothetical protein
MKITKVMVGPTGRLRGIARRKKPLCLVFCILALGLSASAQDYNATLITFDAPGAATVSSPACAPDCGTTPLDINDRGVIVGFYTDTDIVPHGFLRTPDGQITSFEAPGAGLGSGLDEGTVAFAINDRGVIAGQFQDSSYLFHGFVRYPDGAFSTFDAPGAGTEANQGTLGTGINVAGEVVGYYIDGNNVIHGFLRAPDGALATFDAPGAGTGTYQGTDAQSINPAGEINGFYIDANNVNHGFVRAPDGTITTFEPAGSGKGPGQGTASCTRDCINPAGAISASYLDDSNVNHAFVRAPDGTIIIYDVPGAGTGPFQGPYNYGINAAWTTVGAYVDSSSVGHGYVRTREGAITTFNASDAGTASGQGTFAVAINAPGDAAGYYTDANNVNHGFLWEP